MKNWKLEGQTNDSKKLWKYTNNWVLINCPIFGPKSVLKKESKPKSPDNDPSIS